MASGCGVARSLPELPQLDLERFQGDVRKAIAGEAAQANANPTDAYRVLRLGMVLHAHDRFQAAAQCYSRAYALDPKRFDTLYCWGQALASIGNYAQAAERLRQALAIRPESIPARLKLGDVLRESGDTTQGAELFRRVLIEQPDNASAHYGLGRGLEGSAAMAELRKALALFPRYGAAQFALAAAYRQAGDPVKLVWEEVQQTREIAIPFEFTDLPLP